MKQWRGMSRRMAWVSVALAVFSGSPAWAKRRGKHAVPSLVVLTAFWLLPFTPRTIVPAAASGCQLHSAKGDIQHVIFLIFDTDTRPTMLTLVGLQDTYDHDGRVLLEQLHDWAVPQTLQTHREALRQLGKVYKQLNAPLGQFGMDALAIPTRAIKSGSSNDDSTYTTLEDKLNAFTHQRDELAEQIAIHAGGGSFWGTGAREGTGTGSDCQSRAIAAPGASRCTALT